MTREQIFMQALLAVGPSPDTEDTAFADPPTPTPGGWGEWRAAMDHWLGCNYPDKDLDWFDFEEWQFAEARKLRSKENETSICNTGTDAGATDVGK